MRKAITGLAALPPDVLVTVPGDSVKVMDFHRATEQIELGRRLTVKALDEAFGDEVPDELGAADTRREIGA